MKKSRRVNGRTSRNNQIVQQEPPRRRSSSSGRESDRGRQRELNKREYARTQNANRHRRRRKRARRLIYFILILFVLASAAVITSAVFFKVTTVEMTSETGRYSSEELISATGIQAGDNLFSFKSSEISGKLGQQFPYLEEVKIKRKLPGTVQIAVTQAQETFAIKEDSANYTILSRAGKVLNRSASTPSANVLKVTGIKLGEVALGAKLKIEEIENFATLNEVMKALEERGLATVKGIDVSDKFNLMIDYNDQLSIYVGSVAQISYKLQFAKYVIENGVQETETAVIDVSTAGKAVVKPTVKDSSVSSNTSSDTQSELKQDSSDS